MNPTLDPRIESFSKKFSNDTPWVRLIYNAIELSLITDHNWQLDLSKVSEIVKNHTLILDLSTDPFHGHEQSVVESLSPVTDDFVILSGDINYLGQQNPNVCYFPFFFLALQSLHKHSSDVVGNNQRQYRLGSLNGRCRPHRIENYIKLRRTGLLQDSIFSMSDSYNHDQELLESHGDFVDEDTLGEFLDLINRGELQKGYMDSIDQLWNSDHRVYTDCFINLVTETAVDHRQVFFSEKTYKPFSAGQWPLFLSSAGHVDFLRKLGLDMFDDFIDHSYDSEPNWHKRIDMLHNELARLFSQDLKSNFAATTQRRLSNQDYLYSESLYNKITTDCNQIIGKLHGC